MARSLRSARRHAGVGQRQLDVAPRRHRRQQVELLEDEADASVADLGQRVSFMPLTSSPASR